MAQIGMLIGIFIAGSSRKHVFAMQFEHVSFPGGLGQGCEIRRPSAVRGNFFMLMGVHTVLFLSVD